MLLLKRRTPAAAPALCVALLAAGCTAGYEAGREAQAPEPGADSGTGTEAAPSYTAVMEVEGCGASYRSWAALPKRRRFSWKFWKNRLLWYPSAAAWEMVRVAGRVYRPR